MARLPLTLAILASLSLTGCGDDPELVRKREEQRAEIRRLEGELSLLREKLRNAPKDQSEELEELREKTLAEQAKISELEITVTSLDSEKRNLEEQLKDYQRQYPIR